MGRVDEHLPGLGLSLRCRPSGLGSIMTSAKLYSLELKVRYCWE